MESLNRRRPLNRAEAVDRLEPLERADLPGKRSGAFKFRFMVSCRTIGTAGTGLAC